MLVLLVGFGACVCCRKKDEIYVAAARRLLCCRRCLSKMERPAYALALAAALVVCVMQLLALMPNRHWSSVIFEHDHDQPLSWHVDRIHWDVVYDLWGWDAVKTMVWTPLSAMDTGRREEESEGSSCSASVDRDDPGGLGRAACSARAAARAGTIICFALAFMVSGALAKWFCNPAWTSGKSPEWRFKATGGALAVGGAAALGTALFYRSAHEKALSSSPRDELCFSDECGVVGCSQGCVSAIVGGALALFAGCAMAVYGYFHDCADSCCRRCQSKKDPIIVNSWPVSTAESPREDPDEYALETRAAALFATKAVAVETVERPGFTRKLSSFLFGEQEEASKRTEPDPAAPKFEEMYNQIAAWYNQPENAALRARWGAYPDPEELQTWPGFVRVTNAFLDATVLDGEAVTSPGNVVVDAEPESPGISFWGQFH